MGGYLLGFAARTVWAATFRNGFAMRTVWADTFKNCYVVRTVWEATFCSAKALMRIAVKRLRRNHVPMVISR